jgi:two-component system OmpR family response regulator
MKHNATGPATRVRILIVDDDESLCSELSNYLDKRGFEVLTAASAEELDFTLRESAVDLILLEVDIPGGQGLAVCARLCAKPSPRPAVLLLSECENATDCIVGLELGADDYLAKPCNPRELLARVRAVLRRCHVAAAPPPLECRFAGLRLDLLRRQLRSEDGSRVGLTAGEFQILKTLLERPNQVVSRDRLLDGAQDPAWGRHARAIDVQVCRLRRKLDQAWPGVGTLIHTVRTEGYRFRATVSWRSSAAALGP